MDNQRVFIWAALALVLYLNFMAWQRTTLLRPCRREHAATQTQSANGGLPRPNDTLPELPSATPTAPPAPSSGTSAAA